MKFISYLFDIYLWNYIFLNCWHNRLCGYWNFIVIIFGEKRPAYVKLLYNKMWLDFICYFNQKFKMNFYILILCCYYNTVQAFPISIYWGKLTEIWIVGAFPVVHCSLSNNQVGQIFGTNPQAEMFVSIIQSNVLLESCAPRIWFTAIQ